MQHCDSDGQMMLFSLEEADEIYARPPKRKSGTLTLSTLISIPYFHLDLSKGHVDLFGCHYWEFRSPWQENGPPLNTGAAPREPVKCDLSSILERDPDERHDLSPKACLGILRRAKERGKPLPERLEWALMAQAGLLPMNFQAAEMRAYHINRRDEDTNLYGVAGTLMATSNMQMQTFINGDSVVFAANQREKVNCRKAARELLEMEKKSIRITDKNLEKYLGREKVLFDDANEEDQIGIVRGLAWTSVGGDTLQIEVNVMPGKGEFLLTGQLGDVMKESAQAGISFIRSVAEQYSESRLRLQEVHYR